MMDEVEGKLHQDCGFEKRGVMVASSQVRGDWADLDELNALAIREEPQAVSTGALSLDLSILS